MSDISVATENARSPSWVKLDGIVYLRVSVEERSPCRQDDAAVVWTIPLTDWLTDWHLINM